MGLVVNLAERTVSGFAEFWQRARHQHRCARLWRIIRQMRVFVTPLERCDYPRDTDHTVDVAPNGVGSPKVRDVLTTEREEDAAIQI
jgi:hypothetical protein